MECEYCKKKLSTLSSLNYHKKTNRSCLAIQIKEVNINTNVCEFCNKTLNSKQTLKVHIKNCKIKEKNENEKLKKEITRLENEIIKLKIENEYLIKDHELVHKIASQSKTTNLNHNNNNKINVVNNIFNNPDKVKEIVETQLTKNHIVDGQKGIAHFAFNTLLKDNDGNTNYFCTDLSRSIFKFQNSEGELEKDFKANKLTDLIVSSGLKNKTVNIASDLWTNEDGTINIDNFRIFNPQANEIIMIQADNSVFRNELACLTSS